MPHSSPQIPILQMTGRPANANCEGTPVTNIGSDTYAKANCISMAHLIMWTSRHQMPTQVATHGCCSPWTWLRTPAPPQALKENSQTACHEAHKHTGYAEQQPIPGLHELLLDLYMSLAAAVRPGTAWCVVRQAAVHKN